RQARADVRFALLRGRREDILRSRVLAILLASAMAATFVGRRVNNEEQLHWDICCRAGPFLHELQGFSRRSTYIQNSHLGAPNGTASSQTARTRRTSLTDGVGSALAEATRGGPIPAPSG